MTVQTRIWRRRNRALAGAGESFRLFGNAWTKRKHQPTDLGHALAAALYGAFENDKRFSHAINFHAQLEQVAGSCATMKMRLLHGGEHDVRFCIGVLRRD